MKYRIGIMQGRLSPPVNGRIQTFPTNTWQQEFRYAKELGLACIEWIYQRSSSEHNPLSTDTGLAEILKTINDTNVAVNAITADYFMEAKLVDAGGRIEASNLEHLKWLLLRAAKLKAKHVMLPFVDSAKLMGTDDVAALIGMAHKLSASIEETGVQVHMETDLRAEAWRTLLEHISNPMVRVCFDTGDRASLGLDQAVDATILAPWVGSVHIKDRLLHGHTVPLGSGVANIKVQLRCLFQAGYRGSYVLQASRSPECNEVEWTKSNMSYLRGVLDECAHSYNL